MAAVTRSSAASKRCRNFRAFPKRKKASLLVCQGRRRVGKSTFVRECAAVADHFLTFEGLAPRKV